MCKCDREDIIASGAADDAIRFFVENKDQDGLVCQIHSPSHSLYLSIHTINRNILLWSLFSDSNSVDFFFSG